MSLVGWFAIVPDEGWFVGRLGMDGVVFWLLQTVAVSDPSAEYVGVVCGVLWVVVSWNWMRMYPDRVVSDSGLKGLMWMVAWLGGIFDIPPAPCSLTSVGMSLEWKKSLFGPDGIESWIARSWFDGLASWHCACRLSTVMVIQCGNTDTKADFAVKVCLDQVPWIVCLLVGLVFVGLLLGSSLLCGSFGLLLCWLSVVCVDDSWFGMC